jgi:hypothetical protein
MYRKNAFVTFRGGKSMIAACDPDGERAAQAVTEERDPGGIDVAARQQIVHPPTGRSLDRRRESVFIRHGRILVSQLFPMGTNPLHQAKHALPASLEFGDLELVAG